MALSTLGNQSTGAPESDNVEDIFNTVDQRAASMPRTPPQASQQPTSSNPSPFRPIRPNPAMPGPGSTPPASPFPPVNSTPRGTGGGPMASQSESAGSKKGFKIALIVLIIVIVLGGGAFGVYWFLTQGTAAPVTPSQPATTPAANVNSTPINTNANLINTPLNSNTATPSPVAVDTDQDGLTDTEEATKGTNPKLADSDVDGLNDYLEVMTYGTDPNNPDTDGDTFNDGTEVNKGYNPNGPGRLIDIPSSNTNDTTDGSGTTPETN